MRISYILEHLQRTSTSAPCLVPAQGPIYSQAKELG